MKHRPAVRVALRLMGIYLLATGLPEAVRFAAHAVRESTRAVRIPEQYVMNVYLYPGISAVRLSIALYLIFGGRAVLSCILPRNHNYCPNCGFDLGKRRSDPICPACGNSQGVEPEGLKR